MVAFTPPPSSSIVAPPAQLPRKLNPSFFVSIRCEFNCIKLSSRQNGHSFSFPFFLTRCILEASFFHWGARPSPPLRWPANSPPPKKGEGEGNDSKSKQTKKNNVANFPPLCRGLDSGLGCWRGGG